MRKKELKQDFIDNLARALLQSLSANTEQKEDPQVLKVFEQNRKNNKSN
jgi:hypothetical protein